MTPKIVIDSFDAGILEDKTVQARNGFSFGAGLDIIREKGILQVSQKLEAMTEAASPNNITDRPLRILQYGLAYYALGSSGRIYKYEAGAWTKKFADTITVADEMIVFNGNMYWMTDNATNANMGKFDGATYTDSASFKTGFTLCAIGHPMVIFENKLRIGNGRYVATMDTAENVTLTSLTLPQGYEIYSLAVYGNRLIIGATKLLESALFSWDGATTLPEQMWEIRETPYVLINWKNLLIILSGTKGNIYAFNGASVTRIKTLRFKMSEFTGGIPRKGAIAEFKGNLLFGYGYNGWAYCGIYQLGVEEGFPMVMSHICSPGLSNVEPYSILSVGGDQFYVGWYDQTNCGIDAISLTTRIASTAYWESQIYEIAPASNPIPIKGIELIAKPMASGTSVTIKYKLDNASSWSTWGTINSTNQNKALVKGIGLAKTIQIQLTFTCSTSYSPEISIIRIY